MSDLWPNDIGAPGKIKSPVVILKEVAAALGQKTRNILLGKVENSDSWVPKMGFNYKFYIVAPALNNYRFLLFEIEHTINLYPLIVIPDESILNELRNESRDIKIDQLNVRFEKYNVIYVGSEEEFLKALEAITKSKKTRQVIQSLLSQIER